MLGIKQIRLVNLIEIPTGCVREIPTVCAGDVTTSQSNQQILHGVQKIKLQQQVGVLGITWL